MQHRILRLLGGASLLCVAASCSSNDSTGPGAESIFPPAMMGVFGSTGEFLAGNAVDAIGFGGTTIGLAPRMMAAPEATVAAITARVAQFAMAARLGQAAPALIASPSCTPTSVGAATDTDGDGVPDDMTVTYTAANCTVTDTATGDVQVMRGTIHYHDTSNSLYGFELTISDLRLDQYDGGTQDWSRQLLSGSETATTTGSTGKWGFKLNGQVLGGTGSTVETEQLAAYNVTAAYTPNTGPIPAGGPLPDGTFTLSGSLDATVPPWGRLVTQIVTTDPIAYTDACGDDVSGSLELRLNGSTSEGVHVKWIGCSTTSYEFLGSGTL